MTRKIIEYDIMVSHDAAELAKMVDKHIDEDWQPLGGISTAYDPEANKNIFHQAVVLYEDDILDSIGDDF